MTGLGDGTENEIIVPGDRSSTEFTVPDDGGYGAEMEALSDDNNVLAQANSHINQEPGQTDTTPPWLVRGGDGRHYDHPLVQRAAER